MYVCNSFVYTILCDAHTEYSEYQMWLTIVENPAYGSCLLSAHKKRENIKSRLRLSLPSNGLFRHIEPHVHCKKILDNV